MDTQDNEGPTPTRNGHLPTSLVTELDNKANHTTTTRSPSPVDLKSSPPVIITEVEVEADMPDAPNEDIDVKSDSEAETIVLPGKDGHSPSKIRKTIKHEDHSEDEDVQGSRKREGLPPQDALSQNGSHLGKRKRPKLTATELLGPSQSQHGTGRSSTLQDKRHSSLPKPTAPQTRINKSPSPHSVILDKAKSVDRLFPLEKSNNSDSSDENEGRRRIQRSRGSGLDFKKSKENTPAIDSNVEERQDRSESPHPRPHKRSNSTQLPSKSIHGLSHKKKRIPAPLHTTEYQSDDSSASGRSYPRSSRPRHRAAPITGESTMSPANMAPHKRGLVDSSGQTHLARACSKGAFENAKSRLEERPQDLNTPDHAFNTPLHIASINGHTEIVRMLLDAGCAIDVVNERGDTPLHDAIENGHVDVVEMLLDAGANPRKTNKQGDEPIDLTGNYHGDKDTVEEMQQLIEDAKKRNAAAGDQTPDENADRSSHPKQSPRHSPTYDLPSAGYGNRKINSRLAKTSDRTLYKEYKGVEALREACRQNNLEDINKWLDINGGQKDPKSLLIAAKAGHLDAVEFLLALGGNDPDPEPLKGEKIEYSTPMLCAIGRGSIQTINLLLSGDFDPTRRWDNKTYYEIAQERAGPNYEAEVERLKQAFNNYSKPTKSSPAKSRSPKAYRDSDRGRGSKRPVRTDRDHSSPSHKRSPSRSLDKGLEARRAQPRSNSSLSHSQDAQNHTRRGPGRPRKDESNTSLATSDTESTPLGPPKRKLQAPKRAESDAAAMSSENEPSKPRRKLVSGKELKGEREKQRRGSIASTVSTASLKERRGPDEIKDLESRPRKPSIARPTPSSTETSKPKHNNSDAASEKPERHTSDKTPSAKRDISKDRLTSIRNDKSPIKRQRQSTTPPRSGMHDVLAAFEADSIPPKRRKVEGASKTAKEENTPNPSPDRPAPSVESTSSHDKSNQKVLRDTPPKTSAKGSDELEARSNKENEEAEAMKKKELAHTAEIERRRQVRLAREAQDAREAKEAKEAEEARQAKAIQEAKEAKQAQEAKEEKEAEEAREAQEALEIQERLVREEEAARRKQEEDDRKARHAQEERDKAEQKRLYNEQKRIEREKSEQRQAAIQEQQRLEKIRVAQQQELARLSKLPLLLRWFDQCRNPTNPKIAALFSSVEGYRYDTIRPDATGHPNAREQWLLNTDVALLLGEKDLELSRFAAWERIPLSKATKQSIWSFENGKYSCAGIREILSEIPSSERGPDYLLAEKAEPLFIELDLFFVKVSEFMFVVPNFPHLRNLKITVKYRELGESWSWPPIPGKFSQDPGYGPQNPFTPAAEEYINGEIVTRLQIHTKTSTKPFPENRVPRRELSRVYPGDKEYLAIAETQKLYHLIPSYQGRPTSIETRDHDQINGITPPRSDKSKSINGEGPHPDVISEMTGTSPTLPDGTATTSSGSLVDEMDTRP